jgi:hypothetical protein
MPAENLTTKTKPYGNGRQYTGYRFDSKTSVPGASGDLKTTLKVYEADPTAAQAGIVQVEAGGLMRGLIRAQQRPMSGITRKYPFFPD